MSGTCDVCGKGPAFGHNVSHSHHKTLREFRPNLQKATIYKDGKKEQVKVCTRCLRTLFKQARAS